jgi:alkanesulfonate monooxygenase SsuD/methylene tetrahydromethanopterin reductase-like flavin-dependent oxidoreductase (luciferase family)
MGGGAQLGIQIRPANTTWPDLREVALLAEEVGFDSIYTWDHLLPVAEIDPALPNFEGWQLLAAWGALTTRVRVGMLVTGNTLRHPGLVAKMAVTLDHVTNGRAILGLGAGQLAPEQAQYGLEFPPVRERIARLDEALTVIRTLLAEERTSFEGRFYRLDEAIAEPKPVQERLPLLVGSTGPKMLRVAARHADIWHGYAPDAEAFTSLYGEFLEACELEGRDPGEVVRAAGGPIVTATAQVIAERLRAGVQLFVVTTQAPFDADTIRRVATEEWPRALELAGLER